MATNRKRLKSMQKKLLSSRVFLATSATLVQRWSATMEGRMSQTDAHDLMRLANQFRILIGEIAIDVGIASQSVMGSPIEQVRLLDPSRDLWLAGMYAGRAALQMRPYIASAVTRVRLYSTLRSVFVVLRRMRVLLQEQRTKRVSAQQLRLAV